MKSFLSVAMRTLLRSPGATGRGVRMIKMRAAGAAADALVERSRERSRRPRNHGHFSADAPQML